MHGWVKRTREDIDAGRPPVGPGHLPIAVVCANDRITGVRRYTYLDGRPIEKWRWGKFGWATITHYRRL